MEFNGKHLYLEDRKIIENNINKGLRKFETAKELNKAQSTIDKEIRKNRKHRYSQIDDSPFMCNHFKECKICTSKCKDFEEIIRFILHYFYFIIYCNFLHFFTFLSYFLSRIKKR